MGNRLGQIKVGCAILYWECLVSYSSPGAALGPYEKGGLERELTDVYQDECCATRCLYQLINVFGLC